MVPGDQAVPPSVVRADAPAAKLPGPPMSFLNPMAVQSWSELQLSDCIESPLTRGSSVNVVPPSVVKRNVASVVCSDESLLFAASPAQKFVRGTRQRVEMANTAREWIERPRHSAVVRRSKNGLAVVGASCSTVGRTAARDLARGREAIGHRVRSPDLAPVGTRIQRYAEQWRSCVRSFVVAAHDVANRHGRARQRTTRRSIRVLAPCARKYVVSEAPGARLKGQSAGLWCGCAASAADDQDTCHDQDGSARDQHRGSPNPAGPVVRL